MRTTKQFDGQPFTTNPALGWDGYTPPALAVAHESARVGAVLELASDRHDIGTLRAVVTRVVTGARLGTSVYLDCRVLTVTDAIEPLIKVGHRIRVENPNRWVWMEGAPNLDRFAFDGTIRELAGQERADVLIADAPGIIEIDGREYVLTTRVGTTIATGHPVVEYADRRDRRAWRDTITGAIDLD
ncbi:MAG: hypothetical protein M0R28_18180 [Pigmentiphaga sp.]|nr:hypothetical protein [Pigmentiphaga sp.]